MNRRPLTCASYGPKGHAVLVSIIEESLEQSIDPEQIYQTIATLKDKPEPWDQEDTTFSLPSTPQFIYYVLAPFAATVLIAEDLDVDFDVALTIMQQSSDFGDLFNNEVAVVLDPPSKYSFNTKTIKSLIPMGKNPVPKKESLKAPPAAKKMPDILPPAVTTAKNTPSKALKNPCRLSTPSRPKSLQSPVFHR
ncbi:hypothetical protein C8R45DRAFT_509058 [Mycena sanguinolenta]|nr:hypothetical protein C8R45DRAFT_509058 [Mycena sanguinolenta]